MSDVYDYSFRKLAAMAASGAPTPGGGSVSALAGALGISLAAMVGNITAGGAKYKDVKPEVQTLTDVAYYLMHRLEELAEADMAAFGRFIEVSHLPKDTEQEKMRRGEMMQSALRYATDTPLEIARVFLEALGTIERLAAIGSKRVLSDAGAAAYLCEGALKAVLLNVDINIPAIKNTEYIQEALAEKERLLKQGAELKEKALNLVRERL